jgi:DNA-binding MarR family transcriptional regulator
MHMHMSLGHDPASCSRAWVALGSAHAVVSARLSEALGTACGLGINEFEALLRIRAEGEPGVRPTALIAACHLSQPAVSRLIGRLERQGLVRRLADPGDRRAVLVALTDAGGDTLRRAIPVHAETIADCLAGRLTAAEQEALAATLDRIGTP